MSLTFDNIITPECEGVADCAANQYKNADDECVDCFTPQVSLTAPILTGGVVIVNSGDPVELHYNSIVPDVDSSVVTLEYNGVIQSLNRNLNGVYLITPEADTTFTIRAVTDCGEVTAELDVEVVSAPVCLCPETLPDCLAVDLETPGEIFLGCSLSFDDGGDTLWDGTLPRIAGGCKWGYEFPNDLYITAGETFPPTNAALAVVLELVSCEPFLYRLTFTIKQDDVEVVAWQGERLDSPFGEFTSLNGLSEVGCSPEINFSVVNCEECTKPTIRFDPPTGSVVNFPTLVFIHASIPGSFIFYGIDEDPVHLYSGPLSLGAGQVLKAKAVGPASVFCNGDEFTATYTSDAGLEFAFICDGPNDKAGVFGEFAPNGVVNDYHWRIKITRAVDWTLRNAKIYETDALGVWVTGQAWATISPIQPIEGPPDFAVYPMVFFDDALTQINSAYGDPVEDFVAGLTTLHAYGQPAVPLAGYFRLEFTFDEGGDPITIYKLIPHACDPPPPCTPPDPLTLDADCEGTITITGATTVGASYRLYAAQMPPCGGGVHSLIEEFIATDPTLLRLSSGLNECLHSFFLSVYCSSTDTWIDGTPALVTIPPVCDVPESFCNHTPIIIPTFGPASPYGSPVTVVNRPENVVRVMVEIFGYRHQFPSDVEFLLVGPDGTAVLLMNDCGGYGPNQILAPGVNLLFSDAASAYLPNLAKVTAGTWKPTSYGTGYIAGTGDGTFFISPAPLVTPYGVLLSAFIGKPCNGVWKLFVNDDHGSDSGALDGGWCLYLPLA